MRRSGPVRALLAASAAAAVSAGLVVAGGGAAQAAPAFRAPMPAHVVAPYYETYAGGSPAALAAQSHNTYLTLAFLQTPAAGSCTATWNGDATTPVSKSVYGKDIAALQARGGNAIPSFGGYAADTTGTDIADSCTDVSSIASVYEGLVTTYGVTRIDLDVEADSLSNTAGIDRRNKAVAQVESWAHRTHRNVQFSYTLPSTTTGLGATGVALLQNAVANHARVDVVNIMTFDYYDGASHEMATDTETAAAGLINQLAALYPSEKPSHLWSRVGVTDMPGIDDFGPAETFTTADAATVEHWAAAKGINTLSFWALQRDNGSCVGTAGAGACSGVAQSDWYFSHTFEAFTHSKWTWGKGRSPWSEPKPAPRQAERGSRM
ncbi:Glycosyl hydrolases family 18 [Actinacidiphila yanglinensis]|uniref:Glycosyl hydrolases family 18 n=1 Tax=Actinacidiphila yanglinensis TaxID=310779 RepID=A0A1H6EBF4_9ACTN|nr:chitinase [Actinacidiphila yanglinensis]SEG95087.1 Glycosyl hydrolases family 18 [Actinacidiphila yanglinensis]